MSTSQTSFEDRLARIQNSKGNAAQGGAVTPPTPPTGGPRPPRGGGPGRKGPIIALICAVCFLAVSGAAFVWVLSSEQLFAAMAEQTTEDEVAGRDTLLTRLSMGNNGGDQAVNLAVRQAKDRLASGKLTPDQERKTKAFIKSNEGKTITDIARGNMVSVMRMQADAAGRPDLGDAAVRKMEKCKSTTCLSMIQAQLMADLEASKGG